MSTTATLLGLLRSKRGAGSIAIFDALSLKKSSKPKKNIYSKIWSHGWIMDVWCSSVVENCPSKQHTLFFSKFVF